MEAKGDASKVKKIEGPTIMTEKGFKTPAHVLTGNEEDIFVALRAKGWSEEAIAALKSGKPVSRNKMVLKDERELILEEKWEGKKSEEGH